MARLELRADRAEARAGRHRRVGRHSACSAAPICCGSARCVVDMPSDLPMLSLDVVLFEQVLVNLLDNAARYSPARIDADDQSRARREAGCVSRSSTRGPASRRTNSSASSRDSTACRGAIGARRDRAWARHLPGLHRGARRHDTRREPDGPIRRRVHDHIPSHAVRRSRPSRSRRIDQGHLRSGRRRRAADPAALAHQPRRAGLRGLRSTGRRRRRSTRSREREARSRAARPRPARPRRDRGHPPAAQPRATGRRSSCSRAAATRRARWRRSTSAPTTT